ncbi:hypothetical protein PVAG01_10716 [Phlyctema vagabunda]|uniref:Chitinase n=1 Tax=Phlyctema vagabunda TaxID=108571 RepID=A0ABR4P318_9HELO
MSWMDSWSRPSKSSAVPPPLYLTAGSGEQVPYCHTCGRVISTRRSHTSASNSSPVKYCSERCRRNKPGASDRQIEDAFVCLLNSDLRAYQEKYGSADEVHAGKKSKGDPRIIVLCSEVEELVFGSRQDPTKTAGRRRDRAPRGVPDAEVWKSVDMEDSPPRLSTRHAKGSEKDSETDESEDGGIDLNTASGAPDHDHIKLNVDSEHKGFGAGKRRPAQMDAQVNGSIGGEKGWAEKIEESEEMLQKRRQGQKRAEEKEMVRRAARRGVAFGFLIAAKEVSQYEVIEKVKGRKKKKDTEVEEKVEKGGFVGNESRKKCEAVMTKAAIVVEPSFAKGDWGIRWREET